MYKKNNHHTAPLLAGIAMILILPFSSCNKLLKSVYGINDIDSVNITFLDSFITQDPLFSQYENYYLDALYFNLVKESIQDKMYIKYALQPMQALYFNGEGELISYHVNCNAGGFPHLNWNKDNNFAVFPPKTQTIVNGHLSKNSIELALRPLTTVPTEPFTPDYTIYLFWSYQTLKESKRLIGLVSNNLKQNKKGSRVKIAVVNMNVLYNATNW